MSAVYPQCITGGSTIFESAGYPWYPSGGKHGGIDTVHTDLRAYAPMAGKIVTANVWNGSTNPNSMQSYGNYIVVDTHDGNYWLAGHFASQINTVGTELAAGDYIGQQGQTGNVTGTHTHWERWVGGYGTKYRVDPSDMLRIPNGRGTYNVSWDAEGGAEPDPEPTPDPEFEFGFRGEYLHVTGDPPEYGRYPYYHSINPDDMSSNGLGVGNIYPIYSNIVDRGDGKQWFMVQDTDGSYVYTYLCEGYAYIDDNSGAGGKKWPPIWLLFKMARKGVL